MKSSVVEGVSDTAFWMAKYRGDEGLREDRLFEDPLDARLAGEHGRAVAAYMGHQATVAWGVAMRTNLIDRMIMELVSNGVELVLNLGAALDTRPYRMRLPPKLRWIEALADNLWTYFQEALWIQNFTTPRQLNGRRDAFRRKIPSAPVRFCPDDWVDFFERHGWSLAGQRTFMELAQEVNRFPNPKLFSRMIFKATQRYLGSAGCLVLKRVANSRED